MPKHSDRSHDVVSNARRVFEQAIGEKLDGSPLDPLPEPKNQAAVELGRLGGIKGGKARAKKLSPQKRSEIAKKAAAARWTKI